ncbi:hypothetical protein GCM10010129_67640 [Streptomyces fumigatiscleroticus]|nr:hypothetical protein GCM10010129_67640 [Streptomyces fumigatiscleroticus]
MPAEDARHLYVFRRTPCGVDVRADRRTTVQGVGADRDGWARTRRENFPRIVSGEPADEDLVADRWTASAGLLEKLLPGFRRHGDRDTFEAAYDVADAAKTNELRSRVERTVTDPDTAEKLKRRYRYACERPAFSDTYCPVFNRDNVTLVDTAGTHGIERLTGHGVVVDDATCGLDCLIFTTGFQVGTSGVLLGKLPAQGGAAPSCRTRGRNTAHAHCTASPATVSRT